MCIRDRGVPITPKGNATLVDDFYGDKQLITVTTKAGNYFYILIYRANEDKETSVHFLNQVDYADLLALLDEEPQDTEFCICTVNCEAGNVNENCPLCEKSLRNCTAPEAVKTDTCLLYTSTPKSCCRPMPRRSTQTGIPCGTPPKP